MTDDKIPQLQILVVDDVAINLAHLQALVKLVGHKPIPASNAAQGLQLLRNNPTIAACLVDLNLPDLDGVKMFKEYNNLVRNGLARKNLPWVLVTSEQNVVRLREAKNAGFIDIISKPPSAERIAEFLNTLQNTGREGRDTDPLFLVKETQASIDATLKAIITTQHSVAAKKLIQGMDEAKKRLSILLD